MTQGQSDVNITEQESCLSYLSLSLAIMIFSKQKLPQLLLMHDNG